MTLAFPAIGPTRGNVYHEGYLTGVRVAGPKFTAAPCPYPPLTLQALVWTEGLVESRVDLAAAALRPTSPR